MLLKTFLSVITDSAVTVKSSTSALSAHLTALFTVTNFGAALAVVGNTNAEIRAGAKNIYASSCERSRAAFIAFATVSEMSESLKEFSAAKLFR